MAKTSDKRSVRKCPATLNARIILTDHAQLFTQFDRESAQIEGFISREQTQANC